STTFHVGTLQETPQGVLIPDEEARRAIGTSCFTFLPQLNRSGDAAIRISGMPEQQKMGLFREVVRALVGENGVGPLGQELTELQHFGEHEPARWEDRARILLLVNSYDQAHWAADELRRRWPSLAKRIYHLRRSDSRTAAEDTLEHGENN